MCRTGAQAGRLQTGKQFLSRLTSARGRGPDRKALSRHRAIWARFRGRFCVNVPCAPEGTSPENVHGFLLSNGAYTIVDVPDARGTNAWKINARGDIVGGYTAGDGSKHVFLRRLERGDLTTIEVPGAGENGLDNGGINSRGDIVAVYCDSAPCRSTNRDAHGFLLSGRSFTRFDFPGAFDTNAFGINARGDIVGVYDDALGTHGFLLSRSERDGACARLTARRVACNDD